MQFRAMDWGMENCVLQLDVPPPGDHNGTIVHDPTVVDIWRLDGRAELLPHISWNKAPPRVERLASLRFAAGENAGNIDLHCSSGSFLTFELACSSETPECLLEFWQDKQRGDQNGARLVDALHSSGSEHRRYSHCAALVERIECLRFIVRAMCCSNIPMSVLTMPRLPMEVMGARRWRRLRAVIERQPASPRRMDLCANPNST